jgi:hypothetical protein
MIAPFVAFLLFILLYGAFRVFHAINVLGGRAITGLIRALLSPFRRR